MHQKLLPWLNRILSLAVLSTAAAALLLAFERSTEISLPDAIESKSFLPKNSFASSASAYEAIAHTALALKFTPLELQLPDLRSQLTYHGTSGRPDIASDRTLLYFSLANNKAPAAVAAGEKLYLSYDKKQSPARYIFSPNNKETPLWLEVKPEKNEVTITTSMKDDSGQLIREPFPHAEFVLQEKEMARFTSANSWEIGKWKVDGSLFARQKARWHGSDIFLENHGGEEFNWVNGKQRVDFGDKEEAFSIFVAQGDCLIWEGDRWQEVKPGSASQGKTLLYVKKLEERLISFEVWDPEGKNRVVFNLIKAVEPWVAQNVVKDFKFIGARTHMQCAFEINNDRMMLRPQDWLLLTEGGWKKLETPEEIDDYVNRKTTGALFVFDGLIKKEEKQVLMGTVYNSARTEVHTVELAVQQSNVTVTPTTSDNDKKAEKQARVILPQVIRDKS